MDLKRFFAEDKIVSDTVEISGAEFIHAVAVTRHKVGYKLIVCDNSGFDFYATVIEVGKKSLRVKIDKKEKNAAELKNRLHLYIGACKDLDTVVQKAVELGVTDITPFTSAHTNAAQISQERLNKIVLEASKQTGRAALANVHPLCALKDALSVSTATNKLAFYEFEREKKVSDLPLKNADTAIIIGGEGGFSIEEADLMREAGFTLLTLGKRILRVATAVVSAITLVLSAEGEL